MGMVIDKARRYDHPIGVYASIGWPAELTNLDNLPVLDRDVATISRHSRAIDDETVPYQEII